MISPPTGLNRLVFGDRFKPVFPSRDPAVYIRLRLGATLTTDVNNAVGLSEGFKRQEGSGEFSMIYGLPGKPGYQYTRPFDFFHFEFTAVPNADSVGNAIENFTVRGLLAGKKYAGGRRLSRRVGALRRLRVPVAPDLPARDHEPVARHRRPVVADPHPGSPGSGARRRGLRRGRDRRRRGRSATIATAPSPR